MKSKLQSLFDYQRFENNERLAAMIADTESRYAVSELSDEDLSLVNAAGVVGYNERKEEKRE